MTIRKGRITAGIAVLFLMLFINSGTTQERFEREARPEELVSFDSSLPIKTALEILSTYSSRYENKIIIDPIGLKGQVNVMVNNMYWKRALEYVLRSNLLAYEERERYYEIVPLGSAQAGEAMAPATTSSKEIEINAVFFQADYQTLVEAGIDWSFIKDGRVFVNGNFASEVTRNLFQTQYTESLDGGMIDIDLVLRTFETMDKGEIISSPKIKVLDGQEGKIKVGTNFFLTTRDFAGNTRFTEYEAGTILYVTPVVLGGEDSTFIHLTIQAERSDVFPDPVAVTKAITESKTEVLLLDGEETAIAGLFTHQTRNIRRGIPLLKDLPPWFFGLRYLFGYESKSFQKQELIILLQAKVVPTIADRMRMQQRKRNYLKEMKDDFNKKLQELKGKNGYIYNNGNRFRTNSTNRQTRPRN